MFLRTCYTTWRSIWLICKTIALQMRRNVADLEMGRRRAEEARRALQAPRGVPRSEMHLSSPSAIACQPDAPTPFWTLSIIHASKTHRNHPSYILFSILRSVIMTFPIRKLRANDPLVTGGTAARPTPASGGDGIKGAVLDSSAGGG